MSRDSIHSVNNHRTSTTVFPSGDVKMSVVFVTFTPAASAGARTVRRVGARPVGLAWRQGTHRLTADSRRGAESPALRTRRSHAWSAGAGRIATALDSMIGAIEKYISAEAGDRYS